MKAVRSRQLIKPREVLPQFKALIMELNKMLPDIAELELHHNADAALRVRRDLGAFKKGSLTNFETLIKNIRQEDLAR